MFKQLILLALGGGLLLLAVRRLRQYKLKERYTLLFFFIALPMFSLALWPGGVAWVAWKMGIEYGTVALLGVTALFGVIILELLSIVSVQDRRITTLAQMVGILMQRQQQAGGGQQDPSLPTEEELRAMISGGRPAIRPGRGAFKGGKPMIMSIADDRREDEVPPASH